jgi:hypothetical protein
LANSKLTVIFNSSERSFAIWYLWKNETAHVGVILSMSLEWTNCTARICWKSYYCFLIICCRFMREITLLLSCVQAGIVIVIRYYYKTWSHQKKKKLLKYDFSRFIRVEQKWSWIYIDFYYIKRVASTTIFHQISIFKNNSFHQK